MVTKKLFLKNSDEALMLMGQQDENLRRLEKVHGVQIFVRQGQGMGDFSVVVRGASGKVEKVVSELEAIRENGFSADIKRNAPSQRAAAAEPDTIYINFQGKHVKPRSDHQRKYVEYIKKYDLVFAIGPAGTGKTFLSVACALEALGSGRVSRIVLTRPVVEAGEKLGFLPGDLYEKINPYLKPLYDAFYATVGPERFRFLREEETVEIVPLAYMRGRTIDDAFIILDEAQNTTHEQMKMFLTRLGTDSQMVVTGDITQIDLEKRQESGLVAVRKIIADVEGIKTMTFDQSDVVRHGLVKKIITAYENWDTDQKR
ncbi:MAG: PhoH family protein [Endomicrobiales bacterium]|nr:PhoH family protein [Endomicrobiales bacterium]